MKILVVKRIYFFVMIGTAFMLKSGSVDAAGAPVIPSVKALQEEGILKSKIADVSVQLQEINFEINKIVNKLETEKNHLENFEKELQQIQERLNTNKQLDFLKSKSMEQTGKETWLPAKIECALEDDSKGGLK